MDGFMIRYTDLHGDYGITFFGNPFVVGSVSSPSESTVDIVIGCFYDRYPDRFILSIQPSTLDEYKEFVRS